MKWGLGGNRRKADILVGAALALSLFAVGEAQAQNCGPLLMGTPAAFDFRSVAATGLSAANAVSASITAANTGFLTQSNAFVGAPANPAPGQQGGGVWARGVGGNMTLNSNTTVVGTGVAPGFGGTQTATTTCSTQFKQTFQGFQVGSDVAKLNIGDGWNVHVGTTAGALEASGSVVGGSPSGGLFAPIMQVPFSDKSQSPFAGTYIAATKGNFFVEGLGRYNNYDITLNSPGSNLFGQKVDAHGFAFSGSAGYNYQASNNVFIEPSVGLIWSRTFVDALNVNSPASANPANNALFNGTTQINDITSLIGRAGLRLGTTIATSTVVLQPFVAASVWHDFDGTITSNFNSCANCFFFGGAGTDKFSTSTTTTSIGTFGQYSAGFSGQIINTGWLGFARVDYRSGPNLQGWSGTGGIRYQFTPNGVAKAVMPVKAPVYRAPAAERVTWTGLYIGGFAGAGHGSAEFNAFGASASLTPSGIITGGTIGINYQLGMYVLGIEGDGGWTNITGSTACAPLSTGLVTTAPFFQTTCHDDLKWTATVAGRVGYLWTPRTLLYLKGGVAWESETWSVTCNLGPLNGALAIPKLQACLNPAGGFLNAITASDTRLGGMVGFGTEFALARNWSAKGEVDWIDFGNKTLTASDGTAFGAKMTLIETKVGVNYHLAP